MWDVKIRVVDLDARRIEAVGTRTDGADVRTYQLAAQIRTGATLAEVVETLSEQLWAMYQGELARETSRAALVGQAAADCTANLNARE